MAVPLPDSAWDFRLEQVRSINVSGHKYGLVYPGIGWLVFREESDLAKDLVFYENYLGKTDATFTLNFSTGASMVLAQYYNFVRLGREGYTYVMTQMQENARALADEPARGRPVRGDRRRRSSSCRWWRSGSRASTRGYDESDVAWQLSAERGWMVPAYTLPPERRGGEDHACAGQGDHEPRTGRAPESRTSRTRARPSTRRAAPTEVEREQVKRGTGY